MNNLSKSIILSLIGVLCFASCSETEYLKFDASHNGVYFTQEKLKYSFSVTADSIRSYLFKMPIQILGRTSSVEREVAYSVTPDSTDAVEGDCITSWVGPSLPLTLLRAIFL